MAFKIQRRILVSCWKFDHEVFKQYLYSNPRAHELYQVISCKKCLKTLLKYIKIIYGTIASLKTGIHINVASTNHINVRFE